MFSVDTIIMYQMTKIHKSKIVSNTLTSGYKSFMGTLYTHPLSSLEMGHQKYIVIFPDGDRMFVYISIYYSHLFQWDHQLQRRIKDFSAFCLFIMR